MPVQSVCKLKGTVARDFVVSIFRDSTSTGILIYESTKISIFSRFLRGDIRKRTGIRDVKTALIQFSVQDW